ncbi:MAG: hypothetical protein JKY56_12655 [Kofleriaceae bacterium]|nr:hypothetical protein [Kofleriaceae bacterium]
MIPLQLKLDFKNFLAEEGVGPRKKSFFFERVLKKYMCKTDADILKSLELDGISMLANNSSDVYLISEDTGVALEGLIYRLKHLDPLLEGVQSCIVRASLVNCLRD